MFGGSTHGYFYALDAEDGDELWRMSIGGPVKAAPITYMAGDEQLMSIAAGNTIFTFGLR